MTQGLMKILFVGDVVGACGSDFIKRKLWEIRRSNAIDMTVLNGENSAKGNGIDPDTAELLFASGADVITSGNHIWQKKSIYEYLDSNSNLLRPLNYPSTCPGNGYVIFDCCGYRVLVISVMGNVYLDSLESPFVSVEKLLAYEKGHYDFAVCDIHAEATSEKITFGKYFDGRLAVTVGTHTHVQTADEKILPCGSGYITDLGMTGVYDSVLGMKHEVGIARFLTKMPHRYEEADGGIMFNGCIFTVSTTDFCVKSVERLNFNEIM